MLKRSHCNPTILNIRRYGYETCLGNATLTIMTCIRCSSTHGRKCTETLKFENNNKLWPGITEHRNTLESSLPDSRIGPRIRIRVRIRTWIREDPGRVRDPTCGSIRIHGSRILPESSRIQARISGNTRHKNIKAWMWMF